MKLCLKCKEPIPCQIKIDGKSHNLCRRKYCLKCSPFGKRNTLRLHITETKSPHSRDYSKMSPEDKKRYLEQVYAYQKKTRKNKKKQLISLLGGSCSKCGYDENIHCLVFHHIDPSEKLFMLNARDLSARSEEVLLKEALNVSYFVKTVTTTCTFLKAGTGNKCAQLDSNQ